MAQSQIVAAKRLLATGVPRSRIYESILATEVGEVVSQVIEAGFQGQIIITENQLPTHLPSKSAFAEMIWSSRLEAVRRQKSQQSPWGAWKLEYLAFLSQPIGGERTVVRFYDVSTPGKKVMIAEDRIDQTVLQPDARMYSAKLVLMEPPFRAGKQYEMAIEIGPKVLSSARVRLLRE